MKNPHRFGQSIIADTHLYEDPSCSVSIDLKGMAEAVVTKINRHIDNPDYYFRFNNHRTRQADTIHREQRKSATYFALYTGKIPAFGIESAKSLPLEVKVRQHIYAINGFMELFGIIPETPGVDLAPPRLAYMVISVNGALPVVVENGKTLMINPNDRIEVQDIKVNYQRGLSVDILGVGSTYNDMRKPAVIRNPTRIIARKDFYPCGDVDIELAPPASTRPLVKVAGTAPGPSPEPEFVYVLKINGDRKEYLPGEHVKLVRGDHMVIVDVRGRGIDPGACVVNFKGFVGNTDKNTGEDRGYVIDTRGDVLLERYSIDKKGRRYYIVTTLGEKEINRLYIDLAP